MNWIILKLVFFLYLRTLLNCHQWLLVLTCAQICPGTWCRYDNEGELEWTATCKGLVERPGLVSREDAAQKEDIKKLNNFSDIYWHLIYFLVNCPFKSFVHFPIFFNAFCIYLRLFFSFFIFKVISMPNGRLDLMTLRSRSTCYTDSVSQPPLFIYFDYVLFYMCMRKSKTSIISLYRLD